MLSRIAKRGSYLPFRPLLTTPIISRLFSQRNIIDHYRILDLDPKTITIEKLTGRFIQLSKIHHPDISSAPNSMKRFIEIKESFEALRTELKSKSKTNKSQGAQARSKSNFDDFRA